MSLAFLNTNQVMKRGRSGSPQSITGITWTEDTAGAVKIWTSTSALASSGYTIVIDENTGTNYARIISATKPTAALQATAYSSWIDPSTLQVYLSLPTGVTAPPEIVLYPYDSALYSIALGVEAAIRAYLGFDPTVTEITEYLDTRGTQTITLRRWPVTEIGAVYLDEYGNYGQGDDPFPATSELEQGTDYLWAQDMGRRAGVLRRVNSLWPFRYTRQPNQLWGTQSICPGCVKAEYTIDNTDVLAAATEAGYFELLARSSMQLNAMGAVMSDSMNGAQVTVSPYNRNTARPDAADGFASPLVAGLLSPFRGARFV